MVGVRAVASRSKYLASRVSFLARVLGSCHGEFIGELLQFSLEVVVPDFAWLDVGENRATGSGGGASLYSHAPREHVRSERYQAKYI
jgi:hypothetical protein